MCKRKTNLQVHHIDRGAAATLGNAEVLQAVGSALGGVHLEDQNDPEQGEEGWPRRS